jgi:tRNA pseudouridine13 synthase
MKLYPRHCGMERRVLSRFLKTRRPGASVRLVDDRIQRLWVTALQSSIFNQVVSVRIATLDQLMTGDLAYKHENGAAFLVEDAAVEQPRAERFEISPTGPLIGYRMTAPQGQPLEIEQKILDAEGLKAGDFRAEGRLRIKGARRPLRVRPENVELSAGVDEHGAQITAAFTLPAGSYATVFLRELTKDQETIQSDAAEVASE